MTIWFGFLAFSLIGGIFLLRYKPVWRIGVLMLIILFISVVYFWGWEF